VEPVPLGVQKYNSPKESTDLHSHVSFRISFSYIEVKT